jgi:hypothetical protein
MPSQHSLTDSNPLIDSHLATLPQYIVVELMDMKEGSKTPTNVGLLDSDRLDDTHTAHEHSNRLRPKNIPLLSIALKIAPSWQHLPALTPD